MNLTVFKESDTMCIVLACSAADIPYSTAFNSALFISCSPSQGMLAFLLSVGPKKIPVPVFPYLREPSVYTAVCPFSSLVGVSSIFSILFCTAVSTFFVHLSCLFLSGTLIPHLSKVLAEIALFSVLSCSVHSIPHFLRILIMLLSTSRCCIQSFLSFFRFIPRCLQFFFAGVVFDAHFYLS